MCIVARFNLSCVQLLLVGRVYCSEVCHPRCVFKLYGEINSVKNTNINVWLNDGVY